MQINQRVESTLNDIENQLRHVRDDITDHERVGILQLLVQELSILSKLENVTQTEDHENQEQPQETNNTNSSTEPKSKEHQMFLRECKKQHARDLITEFEIPKQDRASILEPLKSCETVQEVETAYNQITERLSSSNQASQAFDELYPNNDIWDQE